MAHLLTFDAYGHKVSAHGKEWKQVYSDLLAGFVQRKLFPDDITAALKSSLQNPAASSCAEEGLMRVLRNYDSRKQGVVLVEELSLGTQFIIKDGRVFTKGEKRRKRYICTDVKTGAVFLFSPVYEVRKV